MAAVLGFAIAFITPNLVHEYYQLPFLVPACVVMGAYLDRVPHLFSKRRRLIFAAHAVLLVFMTGYSLIKVSEKLTVDPFYANFAERLRNVTDGEADIVYVDRMPRTEVFYFAERGGYLAVTPAVPIGGDVLFVPSGAQEKLLADIEDFRRSGARYVAIPYHREFTHYFAAARSRLDACYVNLLPEHETGGYVYELLPRPDCPEQGNLVMTSSKLPQSPNTTNPQ